MKKLEDDTTQSALRKSPGYPSRAERRSQPRSALTAAVKALDPGTGARIDARTSDVSPGGCYVDTMNPFPAGTAVELRLTKDGKSFNTEAKVAYCQTGVGIGVGMGLLFTAAMPGQLRVLEKWLSEARGDSAPASATLSEVERVSTGETLKEEQHYALEEVLVLLMRKGVLTEEEGEPILRRLLR